MHDDAARTGVVGFDPTARTFLRDVMAGLGADDKFLPCKYFYDRRGSELFERICHVEEYYLTRTELEIMRRYGREMADRLGPGAMLIEYGSGSSEKSRLLLDHLTDPVAYVPVDISRQSLQQSAARLAACYPGIEVLPVCADFTSTFELPIPSRAACSRSVYFPGSTIGNFPPLEAVDLLVDIAELCGKGGGLLIGIDLKKDTRVIEAAYNDREGITAQFNLNLLRRINRELAADFRPDAFRHEAVYNEPYGRVEMYLISQEDQIVSIADRAFCFAEGERIRTEYSHKYAIEEFSELASAAGLAFIDQWKDPREHVAVLKYLVVD